MFTVYKLYLSYKAVESTFGSSYCPILFAFLLRKTSPKSVWSSPVPRSGSRSPLASPAWLWPQASSCFPGDQYLCAHDSVLVSPPPPSGLGQSSFLPPGSHSTPAFLQSPWLWALVSFVPVSSPHPQQPEMELFLPPLPGDISPNYPPPPTPIFPILLIAPEIAQVKNPGIFLVFFSLSLLSSPSRPFAIPLGSIFKVCPQSIPLSFSLLPPQFRPA